MEKIEEFVDARKKSWCIRRGVFNAALRSMVSKRVTTTSRPNASCVRPANLPVVKISTTCNNRFSLDEEHLFLFLNCVLTDSLTRIARQTLGSRALCGAIRSFAPG